MIGRWLQNRNGTWHVWPPKGERTFCGRISRDHLALYPAQNIGGEPSPGDKVCARCRKDSGYVPPAAEGDSAVQGWLGFIRRHFKRKMAALPEEFALKLAERMAEVGPCGDAEAGALFNGLEQIMLRPTVAYVRHSKATVRKAFFNYLDESLTALPPGPDGIRRVVAAFNAWQAVTARPVAVEKYRPDRVISVMAQLPDPAPYVKRLAAEGATGLALVFHPATFERAKRDPALRGLFWDGAKRPDQLAQLNILTD